MYTHAHMPLICMRRTYKPHTYIYATFQHAWTSALVIAWTSLVAFVSLPPKIFTFPHTCVVFSWISHFLMHASLSYGFAVFSCMHHCNASSASGCIQMLL